MDAKILIKNDIIVANGLYKIKIRVYEVENDQKFPENVKVSLALIDLTIGKVVLLIDNHEPFGFHIHSGLPQDHGIRESLNITSYEEAIDCFREEVRRIINE
ncbi:MAG: hypothetical protein HQK51_12390 [Oligoflexia bacterium]|nr:hypothetical protein [Oligoflexia bacterium]